MTTRRWLFGGLPVLAFAALLYFVADVPAASTWRYPVKGNPGTGHVVVGRDANNLTSITGGAAGTVLTSAGANALPTWNAAGAQATLTGDGTGILSGYRRQIIVAATGTTALTAAQSGAVVVNTGTSGTTTFTLPAVAAGLNYCFLEGGDAAGELLVGVTGTNTVVGKTHGAENATGINTASSTGIKNTAATNVKGDIACVVGMTDNSTWAMTSVAGVWASR